MTDNLVIAKCGHEVKRVIKHRFEAWGLGLESTNGYLHLIAHA